MHCRVAGLPVGFPADLVGEAQHAWERLRDTGRHVGSESPGRLAMEHAQRVHPRRDLEGLLDASGDDLPWIVEALGVVLAGPQRRRGVCVLECEFEPGPDGFLALVGALPGERLDVHAGDSVCAGFALLRDGDEPARCWPRTLRLAGLNGGVVPIGPESPGAYGSSLSARDVGACLQADVLARAVGSYRHAATRSGLDVAPLAGCLPGGEPERAARHELGLLPVTADAWAVYNALSLAAARAEDLRERLATELELRDLLDDLAGVRRPVPVPLAEA